MTEQPVQTTYGEFDRERLSRLKEAIDGKDRDTIVVFDGSDLLVGFGKYLAEYVEMQFTARYTGGR